METHVNWTQGMKGNRFIQAQSLSYERKLILLCEISKFCGSPPVPPPHKREAALAEYSPGHSHNHQSHVDIWGSTRQRCSIQQIYSEDTFSPFFQELPKKHNVIFSISPNTDTKFADFHIPCSIKDVSQKRLASLGVELLSVITRLKYKSGNDTFFLQHCTKHTQGSWIPICGWFQTRCPDSSWI